MSSWPRWNRSPRDCSPLKTGRRSSDGSARHIVSGLPPARDGGVQPPTATRPVAPEEGEAVFDERFSHRHIAPAATVPMPDVLSVAAVRVWLILPMTRRKRYD